MVGTKVTHIQTTMQINEQDRNRQAQKLINDKKNTSSHNKRVPPRFSLALPQQKTGEIRASISPCNIDAGFRYPREFIIV